MTTEQIIKALNLEPLPKEGGYYAETFRSSKYIKKDILGNDYRGDRIFYSNIYYMLTPDTFSAIHQLPGDEIFHFYLGDSVEMMKLHPDGTGEVVTIGNDILNGVYPQVLVKGKTWQGCRLKAGGEFALMGTTMAPGFEFEDYRHGEKEVLLEEYPNFKWEISGYFE
jgi:predicted cupin superfamily sugar epimerase